MYFFIDTCKVSVRRLLMDQQGHLFKTMCLNGIKHSKFLSKTRKNKFFFVSCKMQTLTDIAVFSNTSVHFNILIPNNRVWHNSIKNKNLKIQSKASNNRLMSANQIEMRDRHTPIHEQVLHIQPNNCMMRLRFSCDFC